MERIFVISLLHKHSPLTLTNRFSRCAIVSQRFYSDKKQSVRSDIISKTDENALDEATTETSSEKMVKVAIIGAPNAGKSSLINTMMNHRICPTSRKVHTTLHQSRVIQTKDKMQMILFDTPGLTTVKENRKYNLGNKFVREANISLESADLIAVVHDVSNSYTRNVLHPTVLETLIRHQTIPSILILNKIDMIRAKRILLDLVQILTEGTLTCNERRYLPWKGREEEFLAYMKRPVKYKNAKSAGWPYFSQVFMVSALTGDGIKRVAGYFSDQSTEKPWEYEDYRFTDQRPEDLIVDNVRATLMDWLPNEIPYELKVEMELFEYESKKNRIRACVNIHTKSERIEKVITGFDNKRLRQISEIVVSNIIQLYNLNVSLVLNVVSPPKIYKPKPFEHIGRKPLE